MTLGAGTLLGGSVQNAFQYTIPATGIWFLSYSLLMQPTLAGANVTGYQTYIQNNSGGTIYGVSSIIATQPYVANAQYFISNNGSAIVPCILNEVWTVKYFISGSNVDRTGTSTFNIVRIA